MMQNIRKLFILPLLSTLLILSACSKKNDTPKNDENYIIFGHFYGFCAGEECIEIYCLEENRLLEDKKDVYPNSFAYYDADFQEISSAQFNDVKDLMEFFPDTLLLINDVTIGQPDAGDWGGLYVEYNVDGHRQFWLIDMSKDNVYTSLHPFVDKINEKIELINN
jgi:hypothetical protein